MKWIIVFCLLGIIIIISLGNKQEKRLEIINQTQRIENNAKALIEDMSIYHKPVAHR